MSQQQEPSVGACKRGVGRAGQQFSGSNAGTDPKGNLLERVPEDAHEVGEECVLHQGAPPALRWCRTALP